tara:strand:- start:149 stop:883 length:735 start_codon:yes stop_codon:yes gene_type:complete
MYKFKGFLSFPTIFTPDYARNSQGKPMGDNKRYSCDVLLSPGDPQIAQIQQIVDTAVADAYPSGAPANLRKCFVSYDEKYQGKSYYDQKFSGYYVLTVTAKETDKPHVVDANMQPVMDPGAAYPGCEVWVACSITSYSEGQGGIGGWLNGIMLTGGECPLGRFDNKATVESMFGDVGDQAPAAPQAPTAPPPPPVAAPPVAAPQFPPEGWTEHPLSPGYYYCGQEVLSKADLCTKFGIVEPSFA